MSLIYYSVMGEGRGHAARARTVVEELRERHRIVLYSSHDALEFLWKQYESADDVEVRSIEGLKFHYTEKRLNLYKTVSSGLSMWWRVERLLQPLVEAMERERPDLVISDFEPLVARAAHRASVPVLSFDHQHFLVAYDLSSLAAQLRWWARSMRLAVWMFGIGQQRSMVSAFFRPPLKPGYKDYVQVGPLLRPALRGQATRDDGFLLSYLRRQTPEATVRKLGALGIPVRIYGLGERPPQGDAEFFAIDEQTFTESLVSCKAVVAAAGNQLLGEALYLGKPFFAMPEKKHFEQRINACFLKELGGGDWAYVERVEQQQLEQFLRDIETYRQNLSGRQEEFDGTPLAVATIEEMLQETAAK